MNPRDALLSVILAFGLIAAPVLSSGQQPGKVYRIGYLSTDLGDQTLDSQHCP
jgi:hypothetical protein